jgi:hypothetical protein
VTEAGGGTAEMDPVSVETAGAVSVKETVVAVLVSEASLEDAAEAELAELADKTMLDRTELAAVFVEAWLDRDSINAELLA